MTWTAGDGPRPAVGVTPPRARQPDRPPAGPAAPSPASTGSAGPLFTVLVVARAAGRRGRHRLRLRWPAAGPRRSRSGSCWRCCRSARSSPATCGSTATSPSPCRLLALAFALGRAGRDRGGAAPADRRRQHSTAPTMVWSAVVIAPITEEAGKGVFVLLLLWSRRHVIDGVLDGLVYAGLVGIGFAFTENILYFAGAYTGGPDLGPGGIGSATDALRRCAASSAPSPTRCSPRPSASASASWSATRSRRAARARARSSGTSSRSRLHAAWNGSAFLDDGRFFVLTYLFAMVPGFLVAGRAGDLVPGPRGRDADPVADRPRPPRLPPPRTRCRGWCGSPPVVRPGATRALRGGPEAETADAGVPAAGHRARRPAPPRHARAPRRGTHASSRRARWRTGSAALRAHLMLPQHAAHVAPRHRQDWA